MTGLRISAVGAYAPERRVSSEEFAEAWGRFEASGVESVAVPAADEDTLTMAAAAGRNALDAADVDGEAVEWLAFASTTPPLAEEDLTPRLGSMLGVGEGARHHTFTGSTRAGTRALLAAPTDGTALVVVSDAPRGAPDSAEGQGAGAGAAAFLCTRDGTAEVTQANEHVSPYPGTRFRRTGDEEVTGLGVTSYDRQAFTETLAKAAAGVETDDADAVAVQSPDGKLPYRATGALGVEASVVAACETVSELGDTGAASVPLSLARALADGHRTVLAAAFGSGAGADALRVEADGEVPATLELDAGESVTYAEYLRLRGEITREGLDTGAAYVSVPTWRRSTPQRHRLVAGECPECGALAFPPEGACPGCTDLVEFDPVELPGEGTIEAVTTIGRGGAPPEFAAQQSRGGAFGVALVRFDREGESVSLPGQLVGEAEVGDTVRGVIRRIYTQEGVTRYGTKFAPQ
ncbi:zinc ribbon domain-containing protein [Halomarina litorea]|uniref:zinc ribbon domain-containing protein n=1 Tax=Halomarina litorea TaxID=2961595 RepID=UPI0020C4E8C8|nr:zinc ribbon domain-containing protein [Halomarina sp. BCD28]